MMYRFEVAGQPAAQGSKRHVGGGRMIEQSKKVGPWREAIKAVVLAEDFEQLQGPLRADITLFFTRPKYHYRANGLLRDDAPTWMDKSPDIDKCIRSTFDALTDCGVIRDDSQFVELEASQRYVAFESRGPGAAITITELKAA
jgi:Holliday junction resolvase RusA-like endonuclease